MSWVRLDDGAPDHPKVIGLDDEAFGLWIRALCYCARQGTDGEVPAAALRRLTSARRPEAVAGRLVAAGLWEPSLLGFVVAGSRLWSVERTDSWSHAAYGAAFARDGLVCRYCGVDCSADPTIDHVRPRSQGGTDGVDNLVVACRPCNCRKGGRTPTQAGMVLK